MRRLLLALTALGVLAAPAVAAAPTQEVDVPAALADQIATAKARSDVPVRLPAKLTVEPGDLFPSGTAHKNSWDMGLDAAPDCGGANACFVAAFSAKRGGSPFGRSRVRLRGGSVGRFTPRSCGASCAAPQIQCKRARSVFRSQARVSDRSSE